MTELLRSPAEQQTELVRRHYPDVALHRLDVRLPRPIGLDEVASMDELRRIGERLAKSIDWGGMLQER